jgi:ubiquinone/menaquinone biosynthesis C-methylase UbiE
MKRNNVQEFFNKMYAIKGKDRVNITYSFLGRFEQRRGEAVFNLLENGKRMLDVACGDGQLAILASKKFNEIYGIDISSERIKRCRELSKKTKNTKIHFTVGDVNCGLPFKNQYFDTVTAVAALAFFFDPFYSISEFYRVLINNGFLIIEVPNLAYLPRRISLLLGKQPKVSAKDFGWDGGHLHNFTQESLKELLQKNGFKILKITGSGIFAGLRNWRPSLLCGNIIIKAVKK